MSNYIRPYKIDKRRKDGNEKIMTKINALKRKEQTPAIRKQIGRLLEQLQ